MPLAATLNVPILPRPLAEEILVVRDAMGRPDVLMRVEGSFSSPVVDDTAADDAPGDVEA